MQYNVLGNNISYRYYNKIKINDTLYIYEKSDTNHYKIGQLRDVLKLGNLGEFGIQFEEYKSIYYDIDIALFK